MLMSSWKFHLTPMDWAKATPIFHLSLLMKFVPSHKPLIATVKFKIRTTWAMKCEVFSSKLSFPYVLPRLNPEEDLVKVFSREALRVDGVSYKISRSIPGFDAKHDTPLALN